MNDNLVDISMYRGSGQLIVHGINPYDLNQETERRTQLRTDNIAWNEITAYSQDRWDFYSSANLPLTLLLFGAVEYLAKLLSITVDGYASAYLYRVVFAIFDSLLVAVIALYFRLLWKDRPAWVQHLGIWGVGVFNPVLLLWGTIIPEDKGIQTLFMLSALLTARFSSTAFLLCLSALMTAVSIAFKGIGIFILPFAMYLILQNGSALRAKQIKRMALFFAVCSGVLIYINYPYVSGLADMMIKRLSHNVGSSRPMNGSFWRLFYLMTPDHWSILRILLIAGVGLVAVWILAKQKNVIDEITMMVVFVFTNVLLLAGSLDRMNIGMLACLIVVGQKGHYKELLPYYVSGGCLLLFFYFLMYSYKLFPGGANILQSLLSRHGFVDMEYADSVFALGFMVLYFVGFVRLATSRLQEKRESICS